MTWPEDRYGTGAVKCDRSAYVSQYLMATSCLCRPGHSHFSLSLSLDMPNLLSLLVRALRTIVLTLSPRRAGVPSHQ